MTITDHQPDRHHPEAQSDHLEPDPADPAAQPPPDAELVGEVLLVDPAMLVIGANIRLDPQLDKDLIRSVRDRGVREPIIVRRRDDGVLVVRKGKRRTLAAVETNRPAVRVLVEPDPEPTEPTAADEVDRIIDQLEENHHRTSNTAAETVTAHQQLLDLGLTAGQIARRTHVSTKSTKVTTAVARSALAVAVLARYDSITLDRAAVIAEFDDGTPDGVEAAKILTVTAEKEPHQFDHAAQRLRDQRDDVRLVAERRTELVEAGVRVLDAEADGEDGALISGLRPTASDPSGTELTAEAHAGCRGHAAEVEIRRGFDRAPNVRTRFWCTDPAGNGHAARWDNISATGGTTGRGDRQPGPLSEQEKADRRRTIANNKAWDSATTVRTDWLRGFCARKTPPRNAAMVIATALATGGHDLRRAMESQHPVARELLGLAAEPISPGSNPITVAARTAAPPRATMITLAVLLGAAEAGTHRSSWRSPSSDTRAYFSTVAEWGYPLSDVEQLVLAPTGIDSPTPGAGEPAGGHPEGDAAAADDSEEDATADLAEGSMSRADPDLDAGSVDDLAVGSPDSNAQVA